MRHSDPPNLRRLLRGPPEEGRVRLPDFVDDFGNEVRIFHPLCARVYLAAWDQQHYFIHGVMPWRPGN